MERLRHVEGHEVFRELAEVLADAVQRAVLAVPARVSPLRLECIQQLQLEERLLTPE
jgi:hypothetical protein